MKKYLKYSLAALITLGAIVFGLLSSRDEGTRYDNKPSSGDVVTITGVIQRIDPNCGTVTKLEDGEIVEVVDEPTICDGGTFVTIDGKRIQTESGYVLAEEAFSKHDDNWKPGDTVSLKVEKTDFGYTLDCEDCGEAE